MLKYFAFFILPFVTCGAYADSFSGALVDVRTNCSNISEQMGDLKKMAGINTAISGVGTAAATGATITGIAKSRVDEDLAEILAPLARMTQTALNPALTEAIDVLKQATTIERRSAEAEKLEQKSKTLGNVRTGLLGASTATNLAGAVLASTNKIHDDLQQKINNCIKSVETLKSATGQARVDGLDVTQAQNIITSCEKWNTVDLSKINNKSKGAMISGIVGATTGAVGTITSAAANSTSVREGDETKEQNLNTASNVLAGGTAVAGGVATVFNATQISAVKKIIAVAEECEEALK